MSMAAILAERQRARPKCHGLQLGLLHKRCDAFAAVKVREPEDWPRASVRDMCAHCAGEFTRLRPMARIIRAAAWTKNA